MSAPSLANVATFVQVAAAGGFAQAAARMGVSASATSKGVARLEAELGVKLIHRTTRSVSLTPEGERFFEGAQRLLEEMEALTGEITDSAAAPRGRLTISAPSTFGRMWLTGRLVAFKRANPAVDIELIFDDRVVDLAAEAVDVAVRVGPLGDSANLVAKRLYETPIYTVASPDYLAARGAPRSPDALEGHDVLHYRSRATGRIVPFMFERDGAVTRRAFAPALVINNVDALAMAAKRGAGLAQVAVFLAEPMVREGALVEVLGDWRFQRLPISLVYLDRRLVSPRIRALVDFLTADPPRYATPDAPAPTPAGGVADIASTPS